MKKSLIGIFILLLTFSLVIIYADSNVTTPSATDLSSAPGQIQSDLTKTGQEASSSLSSVFASNVEIPEEISFLPKLLFGIEGTLSVSEFIIYSAIWLLLLLILKNIFSMISFADKITTWIVSIIILLIGSISGGLKIGAEFWMSQLKMIPLFANLSSLSVSLLIILLIVIFVITTKFATSARESAKIAQAGIEGMQAGVAAAKVKIYSKYR